jgi:hypothetical protein
MSKNLRHMTSIQEAANELHKLLLGTPGYIRTQVMSSPETAGPVTNRQDKRAIVVYVRSADNLSEPSVFNSWPVRYELGS